MKIYTLQDFEKGHKLSQQQTQSQAPNEPHPKKKRNLIYACVFFQEKYIDLLEILANSLKTYGTSSNLKDTDFVVFTSTNFCQKIDRFMSTLKIPIYYFVHDNITTMPQSAFIRLFIFNYRHIEEYDKILYLDTDILINGDLNTIFDLNIDDDKLYVVKEGTIKCKLWGGDDFFDFSKHDPNTPAFSSGVLYFRNSNVIKQLFQEILEHVHLFTVIEKKPVPCCMDQPFFVYNAITKNKYNSELLCHYMENNPSKVSKEKIVYHFPGFVGSYINKHEKMTDFTERMHWFRTPRVKIFQGGTDGFGHQLEGTLRLLSLHINGKADYQFDYKKEYTFEHSNFDKTILVNYITEALSIVSSGCGSNGTGHGHAWDGNREINRGTYRISHETRRTFKDISEQDPDYQNTLYFYDGAGTGQYLPPNFEKEYMIEPTVPLLKEAFVSKNKYLPHPSYDNKCVNVCCHIRLGDAVGTRILDNESLYEVVREFQRKGSKYRVIIHSDGDVDHLAHDNTIIYDSKTDVLQILSDFIHADIFVMNYSSMSIAAHLLADKEQIVICPNKSGITFRDRTLDKCVKCNTFLKNTRLMDRELRGIIDFGRFIILHGKDVLDEFGRKIGYYFFKEDSEDGDTVISTVINNQDYWIFMKKDIVINIFEHN
jgi:hypothetical protein